MRQSDFLTGYKSGLFFAGLLIILFFAYGYPYSIQKGPYSIHTWRQSDCYSFALNFTNGGMDFFQPEIHWSGSDPDGKTVSEFPVIYYLVAGIWKVTGPLPWIFRSINLLIVFLGLFYLFRLCREYLKSDFWAVYIPVLVFTSPVLVYYSNNFLMNAPAFGLVIVAFYYYWQYLHKAKTGYLYFALCIFLIAGLLKISALLLFVALLIIHLAGYFPKLRRRFEIPAAIKPMHIIPFAVVISIIILWLRWTDQYNSAHTQGVFLRGIFPIWDVYFPEGIDLGKRLFTILLPELFHPAPLVLIMGMFIWLLLKRKKEQRFLLLLISLVFAGSIAYIVLFFRAFTVHDYYLTNLLIFLPLTAAVFLRYLKSTGIGFNSRILKGLAVGVLILMVYNTMCIQRAKYNTNDFFVKKGIFLEEEEIKKYAYINSEYERRYENLVTVRPYLRQLGINKEDRVISLPDDSPNISLSRMDQKGVTRFSFGNLDNTELIRHYTDMGIEYLIIIDPLEINKEYLQPFTNDKIGEYGNASIFRLSAERSGNDKESPPEE